MTLQEKKFWSAEISKVNSEIKVLRFPKNNKRKQLNRKRC
jgi:hypothetical protein